MKLLKRVLVVLAILILTIYSFVVWSLSNQVLFPESSIEKTRSRITQLWGTTYEASMETMPPYKDFSVRTTDGFLLKGKHFAPSDSTTCAIIFPHGWGATWADMLKYIPVFDECNCDYVMYDHRVHGESEGRFATGGIKEAVDLWAVTEWVIETTGFEYSQIGWVGSSWGAATSLIAAAETRDVGFVIADSPFQDWNSAVFERAVKDYGSWINLIAPGVMKLVSYRAKVDHYLINPVNRASDISEPVLLIHSKADTKTSSSQSFNISNNLASSNSRFYHTDWGNDHVMDVVKNREEYQNLVTGFLQTYASQFLNKKK